MLEQMGLPRTESQIDAMIGEADQDGNSRINEQEFKSIVGFQALPEPLVTADHVVADNLDNTTELQLLGNETGLASNYSLTDELAEPGDGGQSRSQA